MVDNMKTVIFICTVLFACVLGDVSERTVKTVPWPQCEVDIDCQLARNQSLNIVYVKASSLTNDNLYYAFSTIGLPTVVFARVDSADAEMYFNWTMILSAVNASASLFDAIQIKDKQDKTVTPKYMFGVAFTKLIEYDDVHDNADLVAWENKNNGTAQIKIREFDKFDWMPVPIVLNSNNSFIFNTTTDMEPPSISHNGSLSFSFTIPSQPGRSPELPSLKYGVNETQFDFVLANYTPSFTHSRFALEAVVVSLSQSDMAVEETDSIDDEYSPGVFQIINWNTDPKKKEYNGFFQWKPVCYLSKSRVRKTVTKVKYYDLQSLDSKQNESTLLNRSIISALFGESLWSKNSIRATNISFGLSNDGFYLENNYTVWSAAVGYGTPPRDEISITVIIIISAGLGLPVAVIIFGGIFSIYRKIRRRSQYESINPSSGK